jgi:LacI family transcriptional regulator
MSVRLKDIARDLGVSAVTVSKVLRNHNDIGSETRERVLKRIKELNYQPNQNARALATGKSHLVGLIVPDLLHQFFAQVTKGVSRALRKQGYGLIMASSEENPLYEKQEIEQMLARHVDALIIASTQKTPQFFKRTVKRVPYVLVDRKFAGLKANFIGTDDITAGMLATEHLIAQGCRNIAYIGGDYPSTAADRLEGFRRVLAKHGLNVKPQYICLRTHLEDAADSTGHSAMESLMNLKPRPDGVFCFSDPLANGAMQAILERGLRIPEDVSIIGCGNVLYAGALRVPLTSVDQNSEAMGEHAARIALALVNQQEQNQEADEIRLQPTLVVRASTLKS